MLQGVLGEKNSLMADRAVPGNSGQHRSSSPEPLDFQELNRSKQAYISHCGDLNFKTPYKKCKGRWIFFAVFKIKLAACIVFKIIMKNKFKLCCNVRCLPGWLKT
ncbi:protein syndesmos [Platysternon megacephalum]|uniref:Protein syndesmos n=1 Tax=Platysternon megacephalum TaxID=55544 RepID=A0A4D9EAY1_9SAUR|nr:protein syndesmos [Platysternon megacephalum]